MCLLDFIIWLKLHGLVVVLAGDRKVAEAVGGGEPPELVDNPPAAITRLCRSLAFKVKGTVKLRDNFSKNASLFKRRYMKIFLQINPQHDLSPMA